MDCAKARVFMCPEIDDELPVTDSALLQEHLSACSACNYEWEALLLVDRNVRAAKERAVMPEDLPDRIISSLRKGEQARSGRAVFSLKFWSFSAAAVAVAFCICFMLLPVRDSAESLVAETADGSANASQAHYKHVNSIGLAAKSEDMQSVGFAPRLQKFTGLKVAALDVYSDGSGRKVLRACYQDSRDHSFCIDCYQAPTGLLSFRGTEETTIAGAKARVGRIGNHNVVMLTKNGLDYVYASPLEKKRLLTMIARSG